MEIQHFSHEHPLIFNEKKNYGWEKIACKGCGQVISGSSYGCRNCLFFLHKICAELPIEMKHPMHPEHPLTLLSQAPYSALCDACYQDCKPFIYHCFPCQFDLDLCCALRSQSVEHKSHKHPLSLLLNPALFLCYGCGTEHQGISYLCNTCGFWIHEYCASLQTTIKHSSHVHPLTLVYPFEGQFSYFDCGVCEKNSETNCWVYRCKGCKYDVHVNCSTKTKETKTAIKDEDLDAANSIHLPLPNDESVLGLITQFVKQISMGDNKREADDQLIYFGHHHPLTLFNAHSDIDLCSGSELSILNEQKKNDKICNACVRHISTPPFYSCSLCSNFFLHKSCVELRKELQHPCHQHPLVLLEKHPEHGGIFFSSGSQTLCNGFVFQCLECEDYCLDVMCAALPRSILHEVHDHPLLLREDCQKEGCVACDRSLPMLSFGCSDCNFNLHYRCALLPRTVTHRYDEHPFTLIYSPIKDGPDEYYCEFCEEEIDPKWWFYHCIDCDQSACADCIREEKKISPHVKYGETINLESHPHPLSVVEVTNKSTICGECDAAFYDHKLEPLEVGVVNFAIGALAFECADCNMLLHPICALDLE